MDRGHRLRERNEPVGRDPQAHLRFLSPHAQHGAFPAGNLAGSIRRWTPLPVDQMVAIDRWALARTAQLQEEIAEAYRKYEYHVIYQKMHNFCVVDLGGFYLDLLKDRLYTTPKKSVARRSAQTALFHIAESMVRWLAPILSLHRGRDLELHAGQTRRVGIPRNLARSCPRSPQRRGRLEHVHRAQGRRRAEMEKLRVAGTIGAFARRRSRSVQQGRVSSRSSRRSARSCASCSSSREAQVKRVSNAAGPPVGAIKVAEIAKEGGVVDPRAGVHARRSASAAGITGPEVGSNAEHPTICARCVDNVGGTGRIQDISYERHRRSCHRAPAASAGCGSPCS